MAQKRNQKQQSYQYKPRSAGGPDWKVLRRLFTALLGIVIVLTVFYFLAVPLLSNINTFWSFLRPGANTAPSSSDAIPPSPPFVKTLPPATSEEVITIEGFSEPGAKVKLSLNGSFQAETLVDKEGTFGFTEVGLLEGENVIYVQAEDKARNESKPSEGQTVIYDKEPPDLEIESPTTGTKIEQEEGRNVAVRGKTEPGCQVTVNEHWVMVDRDGAFSHAYRLEEGENKLEILTKDKAGNETKLELLVTYEPQEEN